MGCRNSRRPRASHDPLPHRFLACLEIVADLFARPTQSKVPMPLAGVSLAPGRRDATSALRVWGENTILTSPPSTASSAEPVLVVLHDGGPMLVPLIAAFGPAGTPIVIRIGDAIERRREPEISARGIYRDRPPSSFLMRGIRAHSIWGPPSSRRPLHCLRLRSQARIRQNRTTEHRRCVAESLAVAV
jgi:hypothetical protein